MFHPFRTFLYAAALSMFDLHTYSLLAVTTELKKLMACWSEANRLKSTQILPKITCLYIN